MRIDRDVLLTYMGNALAVTNTGVAVMTDLIDKVVDVEMTGALMKRREEMKKHATRLQAIIEKRGGQVASLRVDAPAIAMASERFFAGMEVTDYERMLLGLMNALKIEQVHVATCIGLIGMARVSGATWAEEFLMRSLSEAVKSIEMLQDWMPATVGSAFTSIELKKTA